MRILVDGDGCPVINHTIEIAKRYNTEVIIFCDTAHQIERDYAVTRLVEKGNDSVDFKIANEAKRGDLIITGDYGLVAMCKAKNAHVMNHNGLIFTDDNLDNFLFARHIGKEIRRKGGRTKGPKKRDKSNDESFKQALIKMLDKELL